MPDETKKSEQEVYKEIVYLLNNAYNAKEIGIDNLSILRKIFVRQATVENGWLIDNNFVCPTIQQVRVLPSVFKLQGNVKLSCTELEHMIDSEELMSVLCNKIAHSMACLENAMLKTMFDSAVCTVIDMSPMGGTLMCGVPDDTDYLMISQKAVDAFGLRDPVSEKSKTFEDYAVASASVVHMKFTFANQKQTCLLGSAEHLLTNSPGISTYSVDILAEHRDSRDPNNEFLESNEKLAISDRANGMYYSGDPEFQIHNVWEDIQVHYRYDFAYGVLGNSIYKIRTAS